MMCQILFSGKNKKTVSLSSAEYTHNMKNADNDVFSCSFPSIVLFVLHVFSLASCIVMSFRSIQTFFGVFGERGWVGMVGLGGGGRGSLLLPYHDIRKVLDL